MDIARALLQAHGPVRAVAWVDTQVTGRQRRLDRALLVQGDEPTWLHVEWTLRLTKKVEFRVFEYNSLTALALADQVRASRKKELPPSIKSVVVLLTGRGKPYPTHGEYRTSPPTEPFSGVHFRIEPVYQRTVAELVAQGPFWMIFAPLAVDADDKKLAEVVQLLRAQTTPAGFKELAVAMGVMVEADRRKRGFRDVVRSLLPTELVMQNWIFKEGKAAGVKEGKAEGLKEGIDKGIEKGIEKALVHQFERRLARPLTAAERKRLRQRLRAEGPDKVGDAVLDLAAAKLQSWLASSNGHST
jgi:hypothetical protein